MVTDDNKTDWWIERQRGRSIGPRPELLSEFRIVTGQLFYMYPPDRFLEIGAKRFSLHVEATAIQEIREQAERPGGDEKASEGAAEPYGGVAKSPSIYSPKQYDAATMDADSGDEMDRGKSGGTPNHIKADTLDREGDP
jgi:hypothetical protein